MYRIIDLTFRPYPAPLGNGDALMRPAYGYIPGAPILYEPISEHRTIADILGYYDTTHVMSGVQPGEIFTKGTLTTKPYATYVTYYNPEQKDPWEPKYISDIPATDLVGEYTLLDLREKVKPTGEITARLLKESSNGGIKTRILIIRTDYSKRRPPRPNPKYFQESPVLSMEAAEWLVSQGIRILASDVRTLDPRYASRSTEDIYGYLNRNGILVVEDLANLDVVEEHHDLFFVGFPLPIKTAIGGPARVFAVNMKNPTDFVDCSHTLDVYPDPIPDYDLPFIPPKTTRKLNEIGDYPNPLPGRIEPREQQGTTSKTARLTPFRMIDTAGNIIGDDMYIEYGHGTGTHIEAAFFDPWGRHAVPEEILRRYVRIPADRLVGEACLLDLSGSVGPLQQIDSMHLREADPGLRQGDIAVIRVDITDWYFYGSNPGMTPGLSPDAAMYLVEKGIRCLVLDFAVERTDPIPSSPIIKYTPNKIHYFLHKNDVPIVEWAVNLKLLRKTRFVLAIMALPASHQGGFPAHVIAVEKW
ncbi:MAG: hypothetical protein HPY71_15515 [Firmicutes bacterium]|nr:hypothetical protein [Bacillota bacterium]